MTTSRARSPRSSRTSSPVGSAKINRARDDPRGRRAIAAKALGLPGRNLDPRKVLKAAWPDDTRAEMILRAAQTPTDTTSFPVQTLAGSFRSLMPGLGRMEAL
jgi:hypothetical protein